MRLAEEAKHWSKDPDEGVGAVVVSADRRQFSFGYNGLPKGHPDDEATLGDRELKNLLTVHAERNALDNAPFDLDGATLYVTKPPCIECAKGMIQKGIARVVCMNWRPESRWFQQQVQARDLLRGMHYSYDVLASTLDPTQVPGDDPCP
jgi:dCMP deaminase